MRDQASRNCISGVEFWPAVRGVIAVFRELSVETIWQAISMPLPGIEIACQILHVGVNGCSEHTGVNAELEHVSKYVRGDRHLGCVERVDDDALDAQAPRLPE